MEFLRESPRNIISISLRNSLRLPVGIPGEFQVHKEFPKHFLKSSPGNPLGISKGIP
jgi:hypothetical protein